LEIININSDNLIITFPLVVINVKQLPRKTSKTFHCFKRKRRDARNARNTDYYFVS